MNETVSRAGRVERIRWIEILKGIGILLIMMFHIHDKWILNNYLSTFFISIFFFTGGFLYRKRRILRDIEQRLRTLVIPYFVFGLVILLYWLVVERRFRPVDSTPGEALLGLLLGEYRYLGFHSHLWFLPCYFVSCVLYNALRNLLGKRATTIVVIVLSLLYALAPVFHLTIPDLPWGLDRICRYLIFFDLGAMLRKNKLISSARTLSPLFSLLLALASLALGYALERLLGSSGILWFLCGALGTAGCILLAMALDRFTLPARLVARIGTMSLVLMCIHGPCYRVLIKLASLVLHRSTAGVRESFLLCCLVLIFTLLICSAFYQLIVRYVPWVIAAPFREPGKNGRH